ncbi:MAG: orotidine-5'-phosphate decarboxylase [Bdellovibrionota bacterium]
MIPEEKIVVAIDTTDKDQIARTFSALKGHNVWIKIGMEAFYCFGSKIILDAKKEGFRVFLDLKLHDIPTTVENSLKVLTKLPIDMINVHAAGGSEMMKRAADIVKAMPTRPLLIAVTQLTSTSQEQMNQEQRIEGDLLESVAHYASLAKAAGCDGVVCSPFEVQTIKLICGPRFICVTPGIRPVGVATNDQARVMSPMDAYRKGSDLMVIGRPITQATSPLLALLNIIKGSE